MKFRFTALPRRCFGGEGLKDAVGRRHPAVDGGGFVTRESNLEAERLGWRTSLNDVGHLSWSALSLITVKKYETY